jgi:hypothetical protein
MNDIQEPVRRPVGMTILLVLSLINALFQIFSSIFTYLFMPFMKEMMESGQLEEQLQLFMPNMEEAMRQTMLDNLATQIGVQPIYYLLIAVLFIGSLVGVLKMFKLQRIGFHIYSISQMLILITQVAYIYSKESQSPFFNEFLMTLMFILLYHLYFKRIENYGTRRQNL